MLSEADNWYVPVRLTPEMNQALDTSDIAFGRAVQALQFRRADAVRGAALVAAAGGGRWAPPAGE